MRLLATSREPLHIAGERAWRVPSLAIPDPRSIVRPDELVEYSAAQLFVERAQAVQSNFGVTPRGAAVAAVVAAICARLEGLPLAIELAAAWVRALGVEQILERLDDAFGLLVGGSWTAPNRQQTMRATLDWSHGLLAASEHYSTVHARSAASLAVARAVGDAWAVSLALGRLGPVALRQGDLAKARRLAEEAVVLRRRMGDRYLLAASLDLVGQVAMAEGQYAEARAALRESLHLHQDLSDRVGVADALESIAALAARRRSRSAPSG